MTKFVPYLTEEAIERDAVALLAEYAHARGVIIAPPIPIDDIVEKHLKLRVEFDDTHKLFGIPRDPECDADILGAIFCNEARIVIDESLDPEENPLIEGRYRFTLAHEAIGHWRLHRHLFARDPAQTFLFGGRAAPSFVCRSSDAMKREEWQANFAASCGLMPRNSVIETWREHFGDTNARILKRSTNEQCDVAMNEFVRPLAEKFLVSMVAMRIRLERLGLLRREVPRQRSLVGV